ncbi:glucokinase [Pseudohongiella acticola]|jgi:glucokinase|uniref:glucokinase n=1 Tax=Pseudohongiella acticola TaxID=1524254 RepID=UPI0009F69AFE|nr:glucokinase [Pseudohongiella acticola]
MQAKNISATLESNARSSAATVLVADIGGTNARFALSGPDQALSHVVSLSCRDYADISEAISTYLQTLDPQQAAQPRGIFLAVAAATDQDEIKLTNNQWQFSQQALAQTLGMPVTAINDFTAQAWCLPSLSASDVKWLQQYSPHDLVWTRGNRSIAGPGTGFGAATMTLNGEVLESEPGQCAFAPLTPRQLAMVVHLWDSYPRVTVDYLLSGPGLSNIYSAIVMLNTGKPAEDLVAADIAMAARHGDELARQSLDEFSRMLGAVCGDIALSMGSLGGFFLTGAMLQKLDELFNAELFLAAFTDKGSFSDWCRRVPIAIMTMTDPGLRGCAVFSQR